MSIKPDQHWLVSLYLHSNYQSSSIKLISSAFFMFSLIETAELLEPLSGKRRPEETRESRGFPIS